MTAIPANANRLQPLCPQKTVLTGHARKRMQARGISARALDAVLRFGRVVYTRGAEIYALGRKEIQRLQSFGINLAEHEGIQAVCSPEGTLLTTYRNRNFRGLRPSRSRRLASSR